MAARLDDFRGAHLVVCCARCRDRRLLPVSDLCTRYGGQHRISAIVQRLRCASPGCRGVPAEVTITDGMQAVPLIGPGSY